MSNYVAFTSPRQGQRIQLLEGELRYRGRALKEAKDAYERARLELAAAVDEIGAPADGRTVVFLYEPSGCGPAGIYFETVGVAWDATSKAFRMRTESEARAWGKEMASRGVKIEIPQIAEGAPTE